MTLDLKICGATVVDGTGGPPFSADVGIKDGIIVELGRVDTPAIRTLRADGATLTPGFIDPHTHYDGQAMWDNDLDPSSRHGVTTAFMGNCGVGFAPLTPGKQDDLITLMAGVEDIPGTVLAEGLDWQWETFADYLGRLDARRWPLDIGTQVTHDPVRVYVMGERGLAGEPATDEDVARMRQIVSDALGAGAFAFSTGRTDGHRMADGRDTPAAVANGRELVGIASVLRDHPYRVLQAVSDFDQYQGKEAFEQEFDLIENMVRAAGRPLSMSLVQREGAGDQWRRVIARGERAQAEGLTMRFQVATRGIGVLMGLNTTFHPFVAHPSCKAIAHLPLAERVAAMRTPELKAKLLSEGPEPFAGQGNAAPAFVDQMLRAIDFISGRMFPDRGVPNFEPVYEESLHAQAIQRGVSPLENVYDALLEKNGEALLYFPIYNYGSGNLDFVREMMMHPLSIIGLGDAGAHCGVINDSSFPSFAMSFWPKSRTRGDGISLERIVHLMTGVQAEHFQLCDRGQIAVGKRADINVIDLDRLGLEPTQVVRDLPAGGTRMLQFARGYVATFLGGQQTVENDKLTGARPGRLMRAQ